MGEKKFTNDLDGLRQLLDHVREVYDDIADLLEPGLHPTYCLALFDAAWAATVGKNKLGILLTKQDGIGNRRDGTATIKAALRSFAGAGEWETVGKSIRAVSENNYLPRYRVSGGTMPRTVGWDSPETDLRSVPRMPQGVAAATGSNYRTRDPRTTEWRPPPHVTTKDAFAITQSRSKRTFAVSLGREPHGCASACQDMNKALQAGEQMGFAQQNNHTGGFVARCSSDGRIAVEALLQDRQTLLAFDPKVGFLDIPAADPAKPGPFSLPPGAFLVYLSGGAGKALGQVGAAALNETMGRKIELRDIVEIDDLQEELSKLITAATTKAIEIKKKELKPCEEPLGGDMTILVVDPVEALGVDTMAARPPAPPPVSPEEADFLLNPEFYMKVVQ